MSNISTDKQKLINLIHSENKRITVITGLSKNAGKSTLLNWIVANSKIARPGIITTGRDGEDYDEAAALAKEESRAKPKILIPENTFFTTGQDTVRKESCSLTIVEKLDCKAAGRELWIVKTHTPAAAEIMGPASVKQQIAIAQKMAAYGAEHVFIDGSFDRKAIAASAAVDNILMAVSPAAGDIKEIKTRINELTLLSSCPAVSEKETEVLEASGISKDRGQLKSAIALFDPGEPDSVMITPFTRLIGNEKRLLNLMSERKTTAVYLPTSITERSFRVIRKKLLTGKYSVIISHPLNLFLAERSLKEILPSVKAVRKLSLEAIAVNSYSVDGNHLDCNLLRDSVRQITELPVIDVMECGSA